MGRTDNTFNGLQLFESAGATVVNGVDYVSKGGVYYMRPGDKAVTAFTLLAPLTIYLPALGDAVGTGVYSIIAVNGGINPVPVMIRETGIAITTLAANAASIFLISDGFGWFTVQVV